LGVGLGVVLGVGSGLDRRPIRRRIGVRSSWDLRRTGIGIHVRAQFGSASRSAVRREVPIRSKSCVSRRLRCGGGLFKILARIFSYATGITHVVLMKRYATGILRDSLVTSACGHTRGQRISSCALHHQHTHIFMRLSARTECLSELLRD